MSNQKDGEYKWRECGPKTNPEKCGRYITYHPYNHIAKPKIFITSFAQKRWQEGENTESDNKPKWWCELPNKPDLEKSKIN